MKVAEKIKRCAVLTGAVVSLLLCVGCSSRMQTPTLKDAGDTNRGVGLFMNDVDGERVLGGRGSSLACISKDGRFLTMDSGDGADRLLNISSGWSMDFRPSGDPMAFSPDSTTLAVARSHEIDFYDLESGKPKGSVDSNASGPCLDYSADGSKLILHHLKGLQVIDRETGDEIFNYDTGAMMGEFIILPDGERLVVHLFEFGIGADDFVRIKNITNGRIEGELHDEGRRANVMVSPDGKYIVYEGHSTFLPSLMWEQSLVILDGKDCRKMYSWKKDYRINAMAFSGDSKLLAISNRFVNTIEIYSLENGSISQRVKVNNWVKAIALSSDSRFLAVASCKPGEDEDQGGISIYDLTQKRMVYSKLTFARVDRCEFLSNGKALITSGEGGVEYIPLSEFRK